MRFRYVALALSLLISATRTTHAVDLLNATWVPSSSVTASGSGSLEGSTISITTYATANAGITNNQDWDTIAFISNAGLTNIAPAGGIDLGIQSFGTTTETVTFSGSGLTNPYIFINFTEAGDTFDFGSKTATLIAANNAQQVGNTFTSTGASNTVNDGFVVRFFGTYTDLSFNVNRSSVVTSVAFTVAVPEPSTYLLGAISVVSLAFLKNKRSKVVRQS
ncbi:MAG: hypothetical protein WCJ40_10570 [Planctomycetota bacterium]